MRILVLAPINPIETGILFNRILNSLDKELKQKINFVSAPAFAEIEAATKNKEYLPTLFAMMKSASDPATFRKINNKQHFISIGNSYKDTKFDFIIAYDDANNEIYDNYLHSIKNDESYKNDKLRNLLKIDKLYTREDASLVLPSIEHIVLFLREALTN